MATPFRSDSIYLSPKTKRRLRWLRELEKSEARMVTSDEIAERLLNEKIEADYPSIVSMEKRMNALEDQMVMELGKERTALAAERERADKAEQKLNDLQQGYRRM